MFFVVFGIAYINYMPYVVWTPCDSFGCRLCVGVFHVLLALLLWSYVMCVFTDPGTTPVAWARAVAADAVLASHHRVCPRTGKHRPLRSHYCSVTGRVVLNMDHFCPWVVNTVGFYNRKFFVLFLGYVLATTSWVILTFGAQFFSLSSPHIVVPPQTRRWAAGSLMMTVTALILDTTLAFMLLCFFTFHLRMVLKNETTIEGPSPQFDVGARRNCAQVFGANRWLWLLPVWGDGPDGDGVHWPMHPDPELCAGEVEEGHGDVSNAKLLAEADYDWDSD